MCCVFLCISRRTSNICNITDLLKGQCVNPIPVQPVQAVVQSIVDPHPSQVEQDHNLDLLNKMAMGVPTFTPDGMPVLSPQCLPDYDHQGASAAATVSSSSTDSALETKFNRSSI